MTRHKSARHWARDISSILDTVLGAERFPINVAEIAREYSQQIFPDDPISLVKGGDLPGFDGALYPDPKGQKGWAIIYNTCISSPGRINFTLAHEFGHYLIHRHEYPDGISCSQEDMTRWDSEYRQIEQQANEFAAYFLMPLDDFRRQVDMKAKPTLEDISACASRYEVSFIAAALRWLQCTNRRAVLVVSRDGFILWARSSAAAFKTGAFFKTVGMPPIPVPDGAIPMQNGSLIGCKDTVSHPPGVWFDESCVEATILSDQYDFAISLLHLRDATRCYDFSEEEVENSFDGIIRRTPGSSWLE